MEKNTLRLKLKEVLTIFSNLVMKVAAGHRSNAKFIKNTLSVTGNINIAPNKVVYYARHAGNDGPGLGEPV